MHLHSEGVGSLLGGHHLTHVLGRHVRHDWSGLHPHAIVGLGLRLSLGIGRLEGRILRPVDKISLCHACHIPRQLLVWNGMEGRE